MTLPFPALTCQTCDRKFTFSVDDRELFQTRGDAARTQCRPCRALRKQDSADDIGYMPRQLRPGTCTECGTTSDVKFRLLGHPSPYCHDCFDKRAPVRSH